MADENLQAGDVVYLKSGSPAMTITDLDGQSANVLWFTTEGEQRGGYYATAALTKNDPRY